MLSTVFSLTTGHILSPEPFNVWLLRFFCISPVLTIISNLLLHWQTELNDPPSGLDNCIVRSTCNTCRIYIKMKSIICILWKYFYLFAPIFMVSTKWIDPWDLEFVVLNITGNNQWENCILLDFYYHGLGRPRNNCIGIIDLEMPKNIRYDIKSTHKWPELRLRNHTSNYLWTVFLTMIIVNHFQSYILVIKGSSYS